MIILLFMSRACCTHGPSFRKHFRWLVNTRSFFSTSSKLIFSSRFMYTGKSLISSSVGPAGTARQPYAATQHSAINVLPFILLTAVAAAAAVRVKVNGPECRRCVGRECCRARGRRLKRRLLSPASNRLSLYRYRRVLLRGMWARPQFCGRYRYTCVTAVYECNRSSGYGGRDGTRRENF